jgi:PKD repeat protein
MMRLNRATYLIVVVLTLVLGLALGGEVARCQDSWVSITPPVPQEPLSNDNTPSVEGQVLGSSSDITSVQYQILSEDGTPWGEGWKDAIFTPDDPGHPVSGGYGFNVSPPLGSGRYIAEVRAANYEDAMAIERSAPFVIDVTPPVVLIDLVLNAVVYGSASDEAPGELREVRVGIVNSTDGAAWDWVGGSWVDPPSQPKTFLLQEAASWQVSMPPLEGGDTYEVTVTCYDKADNDASTSYIFTHDDGDPKFDTIVPIADLANRAALDSIHGTASDDVSGLQRIQVTVKQASGDMYWNGTEWSAGEQWLDADFTLPESPSDLCYWEYDTSLVPFADGEQYGVKARCIDRAGNRADSPVDGFTFDGTPPEVTATGGPSVEIGDTSASFEGTATDASSCIVDVKYRVTAGDGTVVVPGWAQATPWDYQAFDSPSERYRFTVPSLAGYDSWTVEVRATDAHGNIATASRRPPSQPSNASPEDGARGMDLTPTLESSGFHDPDGDNTHTASRWQIYTLSGGQPKLVWDSGCALFNRTSITVPADRLQSSITYYWRVSHQDKQGIRSAFSSETAFSTTLPPNRPTNEGPVDGAADVPLEPILSSSPFEDSDGDAHAASQWQVSMTATDYSETTYDSGTDTDNRRSLAIPAGILTYDTAYYWRVRYQDDYGAWSAYSSETAFTTVSVAPDQPSNTSPADGATEISVTPTLKCSSFVDLEPDDTHAASQWLIRADLGDYSTPVFDSDRDTFGRTSFVVPSGHLQNSSTYYWKVSHQDNHGNWSPYSEETCLTTVPRPDAPVARFSIDLSSGPAPLTVHFTDESTGEIDSWEWDFDADGEMDSTDRNPSWAYETVGEYTVSLTVRGPGGPGRETKERCISVEVESGGLLDCGCINVGMGSSTGAELLLGLVLTGLCWGTGYCAVRRASRPKAH